jgi:RHS repeat-associated protein
MAHYRYSAAGQRTYKQVGSQPAEHDLLDGAATVGVVEGGSVRFANLLTPDGRVIGRYTANLDRRYYYTDHLGSTRAVVDGSGTVVETRDYYPFGLRMPDRTLAEASWAKEDYTGYRLDEETGLHYAGARYYMSALGRFGSIDPLADDYPSHSPYHYAANNPIRMADPTGKFWVDRVFEGGIRAARFALGDARFWKGAEGLPGFGVFGVAARDMLISGNTEYSSLDPGWRDYVRGATSIVGFLMQRTPPGSPLLPPKPLRGVQADELAFQALADLHSEGRLKVNIEGRLVNLLSDVGPGARSLGLNREVEEGWDASVDPIDRFAFEIGGYKKTAERLLDFYNGDMGAARKGLDQWIEAKQSGTDIRDDKEACQFAQDAGVVGSGGC